MRIALVCDWFLPRMGGIELHLRDLALALRSSGHDARVVTTTPGPDLVDDIPIHRVRSLRLPGSGVAVSPTVGDELQSLLTREQFDVVHTHASVVSPTAYAGLAAGRAVHLPTVITFHSMLHRSATLLGAGDALLGWSRNVVITAVSSVVAAQLAHSMPRASIGVLGNGVDVRFWGATPRRPKAADVHFVSAMRLTRKKRPLELIRAFASAHRFVAGSPQVRLTIAGNGPDHDAAQRLASELGIRDRVELAGHLSREELRALYATADAFILPSERESFGIAALEARAAGLPVIAMLATGARDFIAPGLNGMLARDSAELARFIARLALEPATRELMRVRNAVAPAEHDWSVVADAHLAIYRAAAAVLDTPDTAAHAKPGSASAAK